MSIPRLRPWLLVVCAIVTAAVAPAGVAAAAATVECGQLSAWTAPDPTGPTDGSLQLGLLTPWTVAATATISSAATTALPSTVGSGPTCLAVDRDADGKLTTIDFAPQGTIAGHVAFDGGTGYFLFAQRLIIPTAVTDAYPALAGLFATSAAADTVLSVRFTVDPTTGRFTGFDGAAAFCGAGSLTAGGDGKVGAAILPNAVLDAADRATLGGAHGASVCATVHSVGTIDAGSGVVSTTADVRITASDGGDPLPATDGVSTTASTLTGVDGASLIVAFVASFVLAFVAAPTRSRKDVGRQRPT